tara:strand:+ start:15296 stop:15841 length:546 start_codon:yes stop_codon:yes gene_type:complete
MHSALSDAPNQSTSRDILSRIWSLELQWFTPKESTSIIDHLTSTGWLVEDSGMLFPAPPLVLSRPPLGWRPILNSVLSIPQLELKPVESDTDSTTPRILEPRISDPEGSDLPPDKAEGSIPYLIEIISSESGLQNKEVLRRAQRKRRALGPVTLWMALALVAREQGIEMDEIVSIINLESG